MRRDVLKIALVISLAFNAAVIGAFVYGAAKRPSPPEHLYAPGMAGRDRFVRHGRRLARTLGVPGERGTKFAAAIADSSGEANAIRTNLCRARGELIVLIETAKPDERAIMEKVDEISQLQGELEKRVVSRLLHVKTILTHEEGKRFMRLIRHRCMACDTCTRFSPAGKQRESEVR